MARIGKCPEDKRKEQLKFSAETSGCSHHTQQAGNLVHPIDTSLYSYPLFIICPWFLAAEERSMKQM